MLVLGIKFYSYSIFFLYHRKKILSFTTDDKYWTRFGVIILKKMIYEDVSTTFFSLKNQKEGVISNPEKVIGLTHLEAGHEYLSFLNS